MESGIFLNIYMCRLIANIVRERGGGAGDNIIPRCVVAHALQ